jgi:hypothetical protein
MALKITEVNGKISLDGNVNSVTKELLKKHVQLMKEVMQSSNEYLTRGINYTVDLRFED